MEIEAHQRGKIFGWLLPLGASGALVASVIVAAPHVMARNSKSDTAPIVEVVLTEPGIALPAASDSMRVNNKPVAVRVIRPDEQPLQQNAAMRAFLDPVTGEKRAPTPAEQAQLGTEKQMATLNFSDAGLVEEEYEDGTVVVDLQGRFQSVLTVSLAADGSTTTNCDMQAPEGDKAMHTHSTDGVN